MEEMVVNSLIMNAPQKPRRSSEHLLALRRQSLGTLDFEFKSESAIGTLTKSHIPKNAELEEGQHGAVGEVCLPLHDVHCVLLPGRVHNVSTESF